MVSAFTSLVQLGFHRGLCLTIFTCLRFASPKSTPALRARVHCKRSFFIPSTLPHACLVNKLTCQMSTIAPVSSDSSSPPPPNNQQPHELPLSTWSSCVSECCILQKRLFSNDMPVSFETSLPSHC